MKWDSIYRARHCCYWQSEDTMRKSAVQSALALGQRCVSTSATVQQAVPAVASSTQSKGWLSGLFGGSDRVTVPLTDPLPGIELPEHAAAPTTAPKTELTTLANGFKVATENTPVRGLNRIACTP